MELFPLSHSMPNFPLRRAGTVPFVPKYHFPLPTDVSFLFAIAPSSASLAFAHHVLVPASTGDIFFSLELEWDASKMLPQSSKKLPRKSWRLHKMLPGPTFPHHIPPLAHGQNRGYLLLALPVAKEFSAKL